MDIHKLSGAILATLQCKESEVQEDSMDDFDFFAEIIFELISLFIPVCDSLTASIILLTTFEPIKQFL
jgi:hypothetical protein